jgi:hypothetical protein
MLGRGRHRRHCLCGSRNTGAQVPTDLSSGTELNALIGQAKCA